MHNWDDDRIYQRNCLGLAERGLEIHYIATGERGHEDGITHYRLKERRGIKRRLLSTWDAVKITLKHKEAILHFHDPEFLPYVFLYRLFGFKVVFDSHEVYSVRFYQWRGIPKKLRPILADLFFKLESRVMRLYHALIVTSYSMLEMYKNHNKNVIAIRNLHSLKVLTQIDLENNSKKWEHPIIYTSGMVGKDRNSEKMVLAFSKIAKMYPKARLRFAGWYTDNYKEYLSELSSNLGINEKVEFLGSLPYLMQFKRTSQASIGFVFLENSRKNRVASSNRLFEYMYCGLPVLVENMPECKRIIDASKAGVLVDSNDVGQIVSQLEKLLGDRKLCEMLGSCGRKAVELEFHFEKDLNRLINLYKCIISNEHV